MQNGNIIFHHRIICNHVSPGNSAPIVPVYLFVVFFTLLRFFLVLLFNFFRLSVLDFCAPDFWGLQISDCVVLCKGAMLVGQSLRGGGMGWIEWGPGTYVHISKGSSLMHVYMESVGNASMHTHRCCRYSEGLGMDGGREPTSVRPALAQRWLPAGCLDLESLTRKPGLGTSMHCCRLVWAERTLAALATWWVTMVTWGGRGLDRL